MKNINNKISHNQLNKYLLFLFYLFVYFLWIYKDYGISIDDSTRVHGLVSFNYIISILNKFSFFNFD